MRLKATDVSTLDDRGLRALANDMRSVIGPEGFNPDYLRNALITTADLLDGVAQGSRETATVQPAIDALLLAFDRKHEEGLEQACLKFDEAIDSDDPDDWREATLDLIQDLPDELLQGVMRAIFDGIERVAADAGYYDLEQFEPSGRPC